MTSSGSDLPLDPLQRRRAFGPPSGKEEFAMAWIAVLGLMIGTMVTVSAFGAEINFRRSRPGRG
jgi:hypothetical protein